MKPINLMLVAAVLLAAPLISAFGQNTAGNPRCKEVGGAFLTNLGVIPGNTTLGIATGDLKGAVGATIQDVSPRPDNTVVFTVQHHFVTESGDTITVAVAHAVATPVSPGLLAIVDYPIEITGGTGRYNGASGKIHNIGEVDLNTGHTIFRYSGQVCFAPAAADSDH